MAIFTITHPLQFSFGLLGNIISFLVFLAPLPTFYRVYKKKSTEGFQSIPYVIALFSCMLWMYYALLKGDAILLITSNSFGCVIETIYISMFIAYAPRKGKIMTAKLVLLLNLGVFCLIVLSTTLLAKGPKRVSLLGWICVAFSASVFAAPLSIMREVIRTKSVEFMPFWLSFFLTFSAVAWFSYGLILKDIYIAIPNILGFIFGSLQMILYAIYKDTQKTVETKKVAEQGTAVINLSAIANCEEHVMDVEPSPQEDEDQIVLVETVKSKVMDAEPSHQEDEDQMVSVETVKRKEFVDYPLELDLPIAPMPISYPSVVCIQA